MKKKYTRKEIDAQAALMAASAKVGDDELKDLLKKKKKLHDLARRGPLEKLFDDISTMFSMVKDYASGAYREVPFGTIAAVAGALLYVLSPVDLIPDFIPMVGLIDDAAVVTACLSLIRIDIGKYTEWKAGA